MHKYPSPLSETKVLFHWILLSFICLITMDEVSSSFNVLLLTQLTNLLRCSKCCFISVANTMSMMVSLRGVYSSLVRFLKMLTELSFHDSWKPKAAWWFSRTALDKQKQQWFNLWISKVKFIDRYWITNTKNFTLIHVKSMHISCYFLRLNTYITDA